MNQNAVIGVPPLMTVKRSYRRAREGRARIVLQLFACMDAGVAARVKSLCQCMVRLVGVNAVFELFHLIKPIVS